MENEIINQSPREILEKLVGQIAIRDYRFLKPYSQGKPGEFIKNLPQEIRSILKNLKSEDVINLTQSIVYAAACIGPFSRQINNYYLDDKLRFDKLLKIDLRRFKDKL